ncbi:MAG: FkbM family methyltransferase [Oscillospiraceae bacterium]
MNNYMEHSMETIFKKKIVIAGGGKHCKSFIQEFCVDRKIIPFPAYITDNNPELQGHTVCGIPVYSHMEILKENPENTIIIITAAYLSLFDQLYNCGLYYFQMLFAPSIEMFFYLKENSHKFNEVVNQLGDENSKLVYTTFLNNLSNNILINNYQTLNPYFGNDIIPTLDDNDVIVSGGTYNGNHIDRALQLNSKIKAYAFEPNQKYAEFLKEKFADNHNIQVYNKALFDCNQMVGFDASIALGAKVVLEAKITQNQVEAVKLDDMPCDDVTLIEMDIEGSERKALLGAMKTIQSNRPKLGICIYHSTEDYIEIPLMIHRMELGYKLHIRQHAASTTEMVCYGIAGR